jgi:heparan-sulfate lyase
VGRGVRSSAVYEFWDVRSDACNFHAGWSERMAEQEQTLTMLDRLDLDRPGLESVRRAAKAGDANTAARELLSYYRARKDVLLPVDPAQREASRGKIADERDLKVANDALQHRFITQKSYPPHDFGPRIDWQTSPVPDKEWIVQLHRMYWWDPMGRAYWHTGDERFAREWAFQFVDWRAKCPVSFEGAWRSLETGIRGRHYPQWFAYFIHSEHFTPGVLIAFLDNLHVHASRLAPEYRSRSNWGLMESEGLAFIAICFPEFKQAREWRELAINRLNVELDLQVYPDGMQRETCFGYHAGCIRWFKDTADLAEKNGIAMPGGYRGRIEKMYDVFAYSLKPDGTMPMFGDCWNDPGLAVVKQGGNEYKRDDLAFIAGGGGTKPAKTCVAYPQSGYFIFRSDWSRDAVWLALKCGPSGGWHSQPDNCSFELFAHGSYLMPDSGCFIYSGDKSNREWFNSTAHHQCLTLDGKNSAHEPKLLLWHAGDEVAAACVENRSYPGLAHRRTIFFVNRSLFVIVDEAIGAAPGERRLHFQLGPPQAEITPDGTAILKAEKAGMVLRPFHGFSSYRTEQGRVAFSYRTEVPRAALSYSIDGSGVFGSLLVPFAGKQAPQCSARLTQDFRAGAPVLKLTVNHAGKSVELVRDLERGLATVNPG